MAVVSLKYKSKQGTLTAPGDVDPGAMIPLVTTTLSSSTANVTFSSIPQNYEHLQVRAFMRTNYSGFADGVSYRINSDTGSNYKAHFLRGDGSSASAGVDTTTSIFAGDIAGNGSGASTFSTLILDILDYTNTNKYKTMRDLIGIDNNGNGYVSLFSGLWLSTNAINSLTFFPTYGTTFSQYTTFALYGIKRAGA